MMGITCTASPTALIITMPIRSRRTAGSGGVVGIADARWSIEAGSVTSGRPGTGSGGELRNATIGQVTAEVAPPLLQ